MLLHAWGEILGPHCTTTHPFLRHWIAHKLALPLNNCCGFQIANPSSAFRGNLFFLPRQKFDDSLDFEVYPFFQLNIHISLCSFISVESLLWLLSTHDEACLLRKTQIQKLQGDSEESRKMRSQMLANANLTNLLWWIFVLAKAILLMRRFVIWP